MTGKLLDTTVLIDLSRGNTDAADFIDAVRASGTPLFISVISAMELIVGCRDKGEVEKAEKLIADFGLVHISPAESARAYDLILAFSKSHGLAIPDAFIAATAIIQGLDLSSDNARHFKMVPNLTVERPY
jgi:predicted nucleic acid-binding protein